MKAGHRLWSGMLLAATAVIAACGGESNPSRTTPTPPLEVPQPIEIGRGTALKIGVSATLTGDEAGLGWDLADAVELAVRDHGAMLRGHPVTVTRMDDGCADPEKAANAARSLVRDAAVIGVIGPMCTTGAQAADSVYDAAHLVHILPAATRSDLSQQGEQYFFRTSWIDDAQARIQAAYARDRAGVDAVMLVDDAEPYGRALADAFAAAFQDAGGVIASRERIERGDNEFGALVRKANNANADAVVFEGLSPEGPLLVKALRDGGYTGLFIAPDGLFNQRDFIDALRDPGTGISPAEGALVTGGPTPDTAFLERFQGTFQRAPGTPFVLQAHDATTALLTAIESVATQRADGALVIDRARLGEALRAQEFEGLTGAISFDEYGDRRGDRPREAGLTVYRVVDGRFQAQPD